MDSDLEKQINKVLESAYDYKAALKRINRTEDEISQLRELVRSDKKIPPFVTDKHVSLVSIVDSSGNRSCIKTTQMCFRRLTAQDN